MTANKFSVLMCVYAGDCVPHFEVALCSVLEQNIKPTEIVIVQDGPVSKLCEQVIVKYSAKHASIKLISLEENKGHGIARNEGLKACSYDFVAIADADDICNKYRFDKQLSVLVSDNDIAVVSSNLAEFSSSPDKIVSYKRLPVSHEELLDVMKWKCPLNQPAVMFRRSAVNKVGGYIDWFHNEDYYLWIRLAKAGYKFQNIAEPLVYFRTSPEMIERRAGIKYFKSEAKIQLLLLKEGFGGLFSVSFGILVRFFVQVLMTNKMRTVFYKKLMRKGE